MKKTLIFTAIACTGLILSSCGNSKSAKYYEAVNYASEEAFLAEDAMPSVKSTKRSVASSNGTMADAEVQRKLILNGSARIETSSITNLDDKVDLWVKGFGGYISYSDWSERGFYVTVKVPCEKFYDAMNSTSDFGKVKNHNINTNDVTDEYYDLESRIETKKILRDKLQGYLKQAANLKDMLEVERQLNEVQSELESIEGRMKRLSKQIDFSTISLEFNLPMGQTDQGFIFPDWGDGFRSFISDVLGFIENFVFGICYLVVIGVPLVATGLLLFWILFGKIGILRKLFNKLKK